MLTLAASWAVVTLSIAFALVCLFLMLVILIQKPKGGGLSGAFGGAGGSAQAAFGAKTGDVLTWFTVVCFVLFLGLAMGLTWVIHYERPDRAPTPSNAQAAEEAAERATDLPLTGDNEETPAAGAAATGATSTPAPETLETPEAPATPPVEQTTPAPAPEAPAAPETPATPETPAQP